MVRSAFRDPAKVPLRPIEQAHWIWYPGGQPAVSESPGTWYFRSLVELPDDKPLQTARLQITADNSFEVWINGQRAGAGDNFHLAPMLDVVELLQPGPNVLAVTATNGGDGPNPAGLIAALEVVFADGSRQCFPSGRQWRASKVPEEHWRQQIAGAKDWVPVQELGPSDMAPWQLHAQQEACPTLYPHYRATAALLERKAYHPISSRMVRSATRIGARLPPTSTSLRIQRTSPSWQTVGFGSIRASRSYGTH